MQNEFMTIYRKLSFFNKLIVRHYAVMLWIKQQKNQFDKYRNN